MPTIIKRDDHAGKPTYQAKIRKAGFPAQSRTFDTEKEAMAWGLQVESEMTQGRWRSTKLAQSTTMGELFKTYREKVSAKKRGGEIESIRLKVFEKSSLAKYSPINLTKHVLAQWRDERLKEVEGSTVNREMNLLGHVIEKARSEWGIELPENPVQAIERPKSNPHRERRLREGEEEALLDAAAKTRGGYLVPIIKLALETAMRQAELVNLRWEFIDVTRRRIHLVASRDFNIKNDTSRVIPLSIRAVEVLTELGVKAEGPVFPGLTTEALKRSFIRTADRAGVENFHFHDLRHEATSRFFEKGLNIAEVKQITGHKTMSALERYVHMDTTAIAAKLN